MGSMKPKTAKRFTLVFGVFFMFLGLVMIAGSLRQYFQARASGNWLRTDGVIVTSEISTEERTRTSKVRHKNSSRSDSYVTSRYTAHEPVITYRYTINGMDYISGRISFYDGNTEDAETAEKIKGKYPSQSSVAVYYNPESPSESVLDAGADIWALVVPSLLGLIMCSFAGAAFYGWWKLIRKG